MTPPIETKIPSGYLQGMVRPAILLFRGRGIISTLIRWQTRGQCSHAALLMPDGRIIESWQGDGVRVKTLSDWDGIDRYDVPGMSAAQWDDAIAFAMAEVGRGYDYWAVIRFISRQRMPDNQRWFCSELVFAAMAHAGARLFERIEPWAVSPGLIAISPRLSPANEKVSRRAGNDATAAERTQ